MSELDKKIAQSICKAFGKLPFGHDDCDKSLNAGYELQGLDESVIDYSLQVFRVRDVTSVCLLTCGDRTWNQKFTKNAANVSMAVLQVSIDEYLTDDLGSVDSCLNNAVISTGVLIDTKCPRFEDIVLYASDNHFFDANHKWLAIDVDIWVSNMTTHTKNEDMNENLWWLVETFGKLNLSADADVTLSLQKGPENYIYEVYNFGKIRGNNIVVKKLGSWRNRADWINQWNIYTYYRRWDFENSSLNIVAVMSNPPETFEVDMVIGNNPSPGVAIITTTGCRILEEISMLHNIRYNYTITDRWIGGFETTNARVAANSLYFGEQDLTPVLRVPAEIFKKLDILSLPSTAIETRYYYRIPTTGPGKFENQFLRPLTDEVWGCVTAVISVCALVLFLTARAERRPAAAQYALFSVAATFCQQFFEDNSGIEDSRRESSARQLTVLVTGVFCVLIYNYYTSSVVSWLLSGPPPSINSLQELLESPLSLIFQDLGYTRSWLQTPTYYFNKKNAEVEDKMRRLKVFKKKKGEPLLVPLEQGIEMVKAGGYAYHTETYNANSLIARTFNQEELCELGSLQSMEKTRLYAAIPKKSPYKEFFNWNLLRLYETGIFSRIQRGTSNPEISCVGSSPRALALGGAAPAFLLLAFGYFLATVFVLVERYIFRRDLKFIKRLKYRWRHWPNK